ncbi:MAG: EcsC family protein [Pseudonocardia sp.]|uniref:EcsC family protein n=1 Tax=unclassified Pseudonocardia TaxID=2619320 RepID=UPI000868E4E8|nr:MULTISPECIES: EcsC family protein [unclassified Pseudonocardia]MBN9112153.1 EcsC family protein [Pseudonocardia sp.]ODU26071.1 MAG: hypothetical protein ABS80_08105 [Pseudonocardia sp. SCN 72-51]ODU99870.1 MAG: hypothetical protein ABT15_30825 [Pseudonocardia sp. SCN 73-27]
MAEKRTSKPAAIGERLIEQVIGVGVAGSGKFRSAVDTADEHLRTAGGDREDAIRRLVATHVRLAAASGFVTGLGGIATLPVSVPASIGGLYLIATRMVAGIAHLRGYDPEDDEVRSAVAIALLGAAGASTLKKSGIELGRRSTVAALEKVPARVLLEINKRVGIRLATKAGEKGAVNMSKLVPFVGGPIGATVDGVGCKTIAVYALRTFPPVSPNGPMVVEGEVVVEVRD